MGICLAKRKPASQNSHKPEVQAEKNSGQEAMPSAKVDPASVGCFPFGRHGGRRKSSSRKIKVAMLGLDNAGKTSTVLYLAKGNDLFSLVELLTEIAPTVGFESKEVKIASQDVCLYDLGGGSRIRGIWKNYLAEIHGCIFVVDAADPKRLDEAAEEFKKLSENDFVGGKPCLILANKSDLPEALSEYELTEAIGLEEIVNRRQMPTYVKASSTTAKSCHTLQEGVRWLLASIVQDFANLDDRVKNDMTAEKERMAAERRERIERVRKAKEAREAEEGVNEQDEPEDFSENPFQPLNKEKLEKKEKELKAAKLAAKRASKESTFSSPSPGAEEETNKSHKDAQRLQQLNTDMATDDAQLGAGETTSSNIPASLSHPLLAERKPRIPSPIPGTNGVSFHHSMGKLPPLELSSALKPLDSLGASGEPKKRTKKKSRKNKISPLGVANSEELMAVAEEV